MQEVCTSAEVDADYKGHVLKFPENVDKDNTEDYVAIGMKCKVMVVRALKQSFLHSTLQVIVLCLYYALTLLGHLCTLQEM